MTSTLAYDQLTRRARVSVEEVEQWKADHDEAGHAWKINDAYEQGAALLRRLVELDGLYPPAALSPERLAARGAVLRALRSLCALVAEECRDAHPERFGYAVTPARVEQVALLARIVETGARIHDPEAEARALAEAKQGGTITLDELRRRLQARDTA